jgi:hypothetical protein
LCKSATLRSNSACTALHEIAKCTVPRWSSAACCALAEANVAAAAVAIARIRKFMTSPHTSVVKHCQPRVQGALCRFFRPTFPKWPTNQALRKSTPNVVADKDGIRPLLSWIRENRER